MDHKMNHSLSCSRFTTLTVAAVLIQLVGLSLFIFGFFPIKPALSGISGPESFRPPWDDVGKNRSVAALPPEQLRRLYQELSELPSSFDRLILMVIDGLPAEFILGKDGDHPKKAFVEAMPYTQTLLSTGVAVGFHAKAAPPTVTMPCLKAMVSGAIPGYLDVVYNFNTQALQDDNIIGQLFRTGRKIWMFGDDTWLKLFPGLFTRTDGVSSFFVKDTVEVDRNVSRHLGDELMRDDWDIMILHYLGLDHVGHIGGRKSVLMAPKLKEMDEVIERIHSTSQMQDEDKGRTLLVIVSDHGMTEDGNHGGSSYEETDSLALFIGLKDQMHGLAGQQSITVDQVLPLSLPLSPLPRTTPPSLPRQEQQLRAMELNSWQLLSLLQVQLPGMRCINFNKELVVSKCSGSVEKKFCCLYQNAAALHRSWVSKKMSMSNRRKDYIRAAAAYHEFLKTASEWLARRVTDKPVGLLALGVSAMLLSSVILLGLLFHLNKAVSIEGEANLLKRESRPHLRGLDEFFIVVATVGHAISMGSSSMVEEEQYNWHFLTSTLCLLLLREALQVFPAVRMQHPSHNERAGCQFYSVLALIISGRIMRGWHQGGVNWTNLPDISKWLELRGNEYVKYTQIVAFVLVMSLGLFALSLIWKRIKEVLAIMFSLLVPGLLVLKHVIEFQDNTVTSSGSGATLSAQKIYTTLMIISVGTIVAFPWFVLTKKNKNSSSCSISSSTSVPSNAIMKVLLHEIRDSLYVIGWALLLCWCLVQLLLQQPVSSMPISILLFQIYLIMLYSSTTGPPYKQWVEVSTLYYLGMVGHYSMGNSNALATIDVAGAFIGTSSYSTLVSGILMFMITYASPMLFLLSILVHISVKDVSVALQGSDSRQLLKAMLGFPCLVPLGLNSVLLAAYTIVLLLMRNHLFVWSVFSPKFLYVAAATVCIDVGVFIVAATVTYAYAIIASTGKPKGQQA
ncbi:GPI ethanolamine phosphate transferase 2 isoform X2 [Punica granatum]|uniref:GPI ethanolamine phosphate transferase 2 isoform X2 n=1 Tax=Punica granatum TaxID=22663 RepID=A0A6P8C5V1_PUNGR|nr:GPI ethanolamine phosphate transferase 2 isoform X2 [Punica granatum]